MNQVALSYIIIGGVIIGGALPLVALLIRNIRETKKLDEVKRGKKPVTPLHKKEKEPVYMD
jgi:hypothetical protein